MPTPVPDLIYGALAEIRVARGGDVVRAEDQALGLTFLNEILERLSVTPHALYQAHWQGPGFALTPGMPMTIGPTGTWIWPRRPVRLRQVVVQVPPATNYVIPQKSGAWLAQQTLPLRTAPIPEGVVYNPVWPNGELYFWPLPALPYLVGLEFDIEITAVTISDTIDLPPGYAELLRLWTAKKAAPAFAREFSSASQQALTECLADIFGSNIPRVPDLDTRDGGVPGGRGGTYDYRTGLVS